jgi:dolichol-phosphate mannosyltransferase
MMPDVSIVLPVYFNQENLRTTLASLKADVVDQQPALRFELIFVDDGSGDDSFEVLLSLQREHPELVRVIKLTRNFGQVSAIWCGYSHARGRHVAAMSADGQDPASLVNEMMAAHLEENRDVVICTREERDESAYRVATSRVFYWLMRKLSFSEMPLGGFDVVSMSRRALDVFLSGRESHPFFQGQVLWMGFPPKIIRYRRAARQGGKSRWTFGRKLTYVIDGVLSYSYAPLRIMSVLGLCLATAGFLYALLIVILRITGGLAQVGLLTPMLVAILVIGGTQILMFGVMGEYMWRTLAQARARPLYVVDRVFESTDCESD